jgi:hypothetical protein
MLLLIDGYNLLQASDIFPAGGPPSLARSREALLAFLARVLEEPVRRQTTIVFDASQAPPGLPRELTYAEMSVRFAPRKLSADDLLEELIDAAPDPRNLTVVSSDHRVQRAARRRGARFLDSEAWYAEVVAQERHASGSQPSGHDKPAGDRSNPFPAGYGEDVAAEDWRPAPRGGKRKKS